MQYQLLQTKKLLEPNKDIEEEAKRRTIESRRLTIPLPQTR